MKSILQYPHLGIFILAWFVADLVIPLLIPLAKRLSLLDQPGGHKGQASPVPFLGGLGIFVAFTLSVSSTLRFSSIEAFTPFVGLILGGSVMVVLGLLDDLRPINAMIKLGFLFVTTCVLAFYGFTLNLFPDVLFNLPNIAITLLWIVGVTSAMNSLDNTDGVAAGTAAIAGLFTFAIAWGHSAFDAQPGLSYLAIALTGGCLGFLRYNFAPARIYLGDNGSFFLGYALATILVFGEYSVDPIKSILVPCLVLSVPLFDITLATCLRIRDGDVRSIRDAVLYCGRDHLAHLLMGYGLTPRQAALSIYALGGIGGVTALLVQQLDSTPVYLSLAGVYAAFLVATGVLLGRVRSAVVSETTYLPRPEETETPTPTRKSVPV